MELAPPTMPATLPPRRAAIDMYAHSVADVGPGAIHGSRVCLLAQQPGDSSDSLACVLAAGRNLHAVRLEHERTVHSAAAEAAAASTTTDEWEAFAGAVVRRRDRATTAPIMAAMAAPIMHVTASRDGQWLVASDATGCSVVGRAAERDLSDLGAVQLVPESLTRLESRCSSYASRGWAGASVLSPPTGAVQVAAASHFGRWLRVYHDGDRLVHESGTLYPPTSIEYLSLECSSHALLAITEGSHLSVWDDREPRSCSQRFSTPAWLYTCTASPDGKMVGCGGAARVITTYDPRKWRTLARWGGCLKYEVTGLHYSSSNDALCFVRAIDSQLICGQWSGANTDGNMRSFRADSRWVGLAKHPTDDVLCGLTENGTLYSFYDADLLRSESSRTTGSIPGQTAKAARRQKHYQQHQEHNSRKPKQPRSPRESQDTEHGAKRAKHSESSPTSRDDDMAT